MPVLTASVSLIFCSFTTSFLISVFLVCFSLFYFVFARFPFRSIARRPRQHHQREGVSSGGGGVAGDEPRHGRRGRSRNSLPAGHNRHLYFSSNFVCFCGKLAFFLACDVVYYSVFCAFFDAVLDSTFRIPDLGHMLRAKPSGGHIRTGIY